MVLTSCKPTDTPPNWCNDKCFGLRPLGQMSLRCLSHSRIIHPRVYSSFPPLTPKCRVQTNIHWVLFDLIYILQHSSLNFFFPCFFYTQRIIHFQLSGSTEGQKSRNFSWLRPQGHSHQKQRWKGGKQTVSHSETQTLAVRSSFRCLLGSYCVHLVLNAGCGQREEGRGDKR